ncbi:FAD/FMN-containing dehydrogenase [Thalassovita litoralis]|uniref:FAD/FMN-containing dehydrogenase n=1 Tax=Thalassovita litoralis TaxID=1010611 RepID=A0A521EXL8_9RHOB|nr:FAD-binding oxidoreductase [Thalassovita litoralis]SMO87880.1 FAD/FMN-containing dehydrogenase [Thalassovita litoralis]
MIKDLTAIVGDAYVLTGSDTEKWSHDWIRKYHYSPLAVVRPATTQEVSDIVKWANRTGTPLVPISGNTGLAGGGRADGAVMLSLDRMNTIREVRDASRIAIVEAGVVLADVHAAAEQQDMIFPLTFGAKGSAMIGGVLSTNAGGSNVLRYGNTRDLVLGIEAVLPNGEIMNIMSELHKDNSGYNLKHLLIGAEGTLGIITAAVLKLHPKPKAYATAMVAAPSLPAALDLLNRLQEATGGAVEAFEYMPRHHIEAYMQIKPGAREPFDAPYDVNIMVEVGVTAPRDATPGPDGQIPVTGYLEDVLAQMFEEGTVLDAVVAQSQAQRQDMWERREAAAEIAMSRLPIVSNDIALPLDKVATFLEIMETRLPQVDPAAQPVIVAHLGDGNIHYTVWPGSQDEDVHDAIMEATEEEVLKLGGSFSAEHGIGTSKLPSMRRRKNPVALQTMKAIKAALDPNNILNPGKLLP